MKPQISFDQIKDGDKHAFERLFRAYYEKVHRFIWGYVQSGAVAEELAQDVFLRIWEKREEIVITHSVKAYLFRTARNKSIDWLRHEKVEQEWEQEKQFLHDPEQEPGLNKRLHDKQMVDKVKAAIAGMPQRRREVFMLSRYEQMTYAEIASFLGISESTVETHMSRALETLRDKFLPLLTLAALALLQ